MSSFYRTYNLAEMQELQMAESSAIYGINSTKEMYINKWEKATSPEEKSKILKEYIKEHNSLTKDILDIIKNAERKGVRHSFDMSKYQILKDDFTF